MCIRDSGQSDCSISGEAPWEEKSVFNRGRCTADRNRNHISGRYEYPDYYCGRGNLGLWLWNQGKYLLFNAGGSAAVQTPEALFAIKAMYLYIPMILLICSIITMAFYRLDSQFADIQKDLAQRRSAQKNKLNSSTEEEKL